MSTAGRSIETENRMVVARAEREGNGELLFDRCHLSLQDDSVMAMREVTPNSTVNVVTMVNFMPCTF